MTGKSQHRIDVSVPEKMLAKLEIYIFLYILKCV